MQTNDFLRFIEEFKKLIDRIKALETAFLRLRTLVFPTNAGRLSPPKYTTDPASPQNGDIWYNMTTHKFRGRANGSSIDLH
jgi:hypothetical protein